MKCPEGYSIQARTKASEMVCTSPAMHPTLQAGQRSRDWTKGYANILCVRGHSVENYEIMHNKQWRHYVLDRGLNNQIMIDSLLNRQRKRHGVDLRDSLPCFR